MDTIHSLDRDCSAIAGLFQLIINDLKSSGPMWEDFITKASKLQIALKTTLVAFSAFLDAFQRIADSATHTRGATKDVGAALTRLSLRHRAIEARVKGLTSTLIECLVNPLQERLEEWRRTTHNLDKDHTKEYKRARTDIKKRTENAIRLHKKAKKAGKNSDLNKVVETTVGDLVARYGVLEETERTALRNALTEERARYCSFALALKPVLEEEVGLVSELGHLQEVMVQLEKHSSDPHSLPPASEQVIKDVKSGDTKWSWQTPPSSPTSSLGSRKSSMCSISSLNSSSSSSTHSPSHHTRPRSISQGLRLLNGLSQDSGFTSQDTLNRPIQAVSFAFPQNSGHSNNSVSDGSHTPSPAAATTATWPNLTDPSLQHKSASATGLHMLADRPHTISSAYERGKDRLPLTVYTFQPPDGRCDPALPQVSSQPVSPVCYEFEGGNSAIVGLTATITRRSSRTSLQNASSSASQESLSAASKLKPPIPTRCSSLERPFIPDKKPSIRHLQQQQQLLMQLQQKEQQLELTEEDSRKQTSSPQNSENQGLVPDYNKTAPDMVLPQPVYSNMAELKNEYLAQQQTSTITEVTESDGGSSHTSLGSSGYGSQPNMALDHMSRLEDCEAGKYCTLRPHSLAVFPQSLIFPFQDNYVQGYIASRTGSLRRGQKPPPPVRRTSSITSTSSLATSSFPSNSLMGSFSSSSINSSTSTVLSSPISCKNVKSVNGTVSENSSASTSSSNNSSANASPLQKTDSESSTPVGSIENLPPPPAFLLEDTSAGGEAKSLQDPDTTTPEGILCMTQSFGPPQPIQDECLQRRMLSVSETVKSLQDCCHQPPSPITHRRAQSLRMSAPSIATPQPVVPLQEERRSSLESTRAALISSLNSKLAISNPVLGSVSRPRSPLHQAFPQYSQYSPPHGQKLNLSPKMQRLRLSSVQEDVPISGSPPAKRIPPPVGPRPQLTFLPSPSTKVLSTDVAQLRGELSVSHSATLPRKQDNSQDAFIQNLTLVLSQRQSLTVSGHPTSVSSLPRAKQKKRTQVQPNGTTSSSSMQRSGSTASEKASRVRQWISSKKGTNSDNPSIRESLLDQIRKGTTLRRVKFIADRSAPRVH